MIITIDKIKEAVETLKSYCSVFPHCDDCVFYDGYAHCELQEDPYKWKVPNNLDVEKENNDVG